MGGKMALVIVMVCVVVGAIASPAHAVSKARNGILAWSTDDGATEQSGPFDEPAPNDVSPIPFRVDIGLPGHRRKRLPCTTGPAASCDDGKAVFSPDGARLAVEGAARLTISRPGARVVGRINASIQDFAWSPSGRALAIITQAADNSTALSIAGREGENRHVIPGPAGVHSVAWAPDGRRLVVAGAAAGPNNPVGTIAIINRDGSGLREVARGRHLFGPSWPRPNLIAWQRRSGFPDGDIVVSDLAGSHPRRLTSKGSNPVWSPHGKHAIYSCSDRLCSISVRGGRPRVIGRRCNAFERGYTWSPDGRFIACGTDRESIASIDFRTGVVRKLFAEAYAHTLSWQRR